MKGLLFVGAAYLGVVAIAEFWSASSPGSTPLADQVAGLPSPALLFGAGQGATTQGAILDATGAIVLWYFAAKAKH